MTTPDADLIEAVALGRLDALHRIWDRYAGTVHWLCAVYEPDGQVARAHVVATFLQLWTSPLAALRAPSVPEQLTALARSLCRATSPSAADSRSTRQRLDRLSDAQLAGVALLFSGEFRVEDAVDLVGCSQSDLGNSLHTVLATETQRGLRSSLKVRDVA